MTGPLDPVTLEPTLAAAPTAKHPESGGGGCALEEAASAHSGHRPSGVNGTDASGNFWGGCRGFAHLSAASWVVDCCSAPEVLASTRARLWRRYESHDHEFGLR
jgi:hypothetical protein